MKPLTKDTGYQYVLFGQHSCTPCRMVKHEYRAVVELRVPVENQGTQKKSCSSATSFNTNLTWSPISEPGFSRRMSLAALALSLP